MNRKGMTLIEILIVITLLAFVGTLTVTKVMQRYDEAKKEGTIAIMNQLGLALNDYRRHCGRYPTTAQGLQSLIEEPSTPPKCRKYDKDGYLEKKKVPRDGFDGEFLYESDGKKYLLKSLGADQQEGGEGIDADFTNDDI